METNMKTGFQTYKDQIFKIEMMYYFFNLRYINGNEIDFLSFIVFGTLLIKNDSINWRFQ